MYDFIKAVIPPHYRRKLFENPLLDFEGRHSEKTGAVTSPRKVAEYKGLKFIAFDSGYIELQGSIHKFKNNGLHNYDDFNIKEVKATIIEIEQLFQINLTECYLRNLEFGVNITPPINTKDILNNLLIHKKEKFKDVSMHSGNYKQALHQRYFVKVYDKYAQYCNEFTLESPILRFELKYVKMIDLNKIGIYTVGDLYKEKHFKALKSFLLEEWAQVLLYDNTIRQKELKQYTRNTKCNQWQNPFYWLGLCKHNRSKQKKYYWKVVDQNSDNVHKQVGNLIAQKWDNLTNKMLPINQHLKIKCATF